MKDGIYSQIHNDVSQVIDQLTADPTVAIVHPSAIARAVFNSWDVKSDPKVEWSALEQLKQIARSALRARHGHESNENEAYQQDMFTGRLQPFYPTPPGNDGESAYKRVELLSDNEIEFNIRSLSKQADARLQHADALRAYQRSRMTDRVTETV